MQICSKCRRQIPNWANGLCSCSAPALVCKVCGTILYGGTSTGCSWCGSHNLSSIGKNLHKSSKPHLANIDSAIDRPRLRLDCFNQLLLDVYDEPMKLGQILVRQGISHTQIDFWRKDKFWLGRFMDRIQLRLSAYLSEAVPNYKSQILMYWYGFSNAKALPTRIIALRLAVTHEYVETGLKAFVTHLRTETGRISLEQSILGASKG